ncbi:MAG: hypothetical protein V3V32_04435 [Dehalococcoidia bacterium]
MAEPAQIDGNLINDARPLAVEQQGAMPLPAGAATLAEQQAQTALLGNIGAGIITTPTHTVLGVTNATQVALIANPLALTRLFINDGALPIYLAKGVAAVANQGIRLNANGGWHSMSQRSGNLYRGAVNAISTAAGPTNLLIEEGV